MSDTKHEGRPSRWSGNGTGVSVAFFYGSLLLLFYLTYLILIPFASPILWAVVLVIVFQPVYRRLLQWLVGKSGLAALLLTITVIVAVMVPAILCGWVLTREAAGFYQATERLYQQQGLEGIASHPVVMAGRVFWDRVSLLFKPLGFDLNALLLDGLGAISSFIVDNLKGIALNLLSFTVNFFLAAFTFFFLLRDGEAIVRSLQTFLPLERRHAEVLFSRLYDAVSAVVRGTLVTALAQGVLGGVGYWSFGVPYPVFLGLATALFSLLPVGGSGLIWIPAAIYLFLEGSWIRGILLLAWSTVVVSTADNVLKPALISGGTNLPTLFLFFGMLGGLQVFGILGFILGPVLLVTLSTFLEIYVELSSAPADQPIGGEQGK
ncbi:AI-2E family transporter [Candidatus Methylomirabilis sp.]|uniref:AI-2E family transporter n=1 Tax=Candidatus Methylomirabilis sp. TaxID=2032687 RepID=UPI002A5D6022|nr:AI-2E family transporter [Candidatus Methylomirabilis sp.]